MKTSEISISKNRAAVELNGRTIQFVAWDMEEKDHEDFKLQLVAAFAFCGNLTAIEKHMRLNGFDFELEDIN